MPRESPASAGQRLIWLMAHYRGAHGALNCPVLLRLTGRLDPDALRAGLDGLTGRHEALRTTFRGGGRGLVQLVHETSPVPLVVTDLSGMARPDLAIHGALARELDQPIDPATWPLRVSLWRLGPEDHVLCLNVHHLATDAWSAGILSRELGLLYRQTVTGEGALSDVAWQYRHFVEWQRAFLSGDRCREQREFWRRQLDGLEVPRLPRRLIGTDVAARRCAFARIQIPGEVVAALKGLARDRRTTLFPVMLAVYYTLLHRITEQTDLAVASLFANRPRPELLSTVGFLANMLVLRTRLPNAASFEVVVDESHHTVMEALAHQELPFQMVTLDGVQAQSVRDIVFHMFAEPVHQTDIAGIAMEPVAIPDGWGARFDLEFSLIPHKGGFVALLNYATDRFDRAFAQRFVEDYASLAAAAARDPSTVMVAAA